MDNVLEVNRAVTVAPTTPNGPDDVVAIGLSEVDCMTDGATHNGSALSLGADPA